MLRDLIPPGPYYGLFKHCLSVKPDGLAKPEGCFSSTIRQIPLEYCVTRRPRHLDMSLIGSQLNDEGQEVHAGVSAMQISHHMTDDAAHGHNRNSTG